MRVVLEESALADLERICSWIEKDSPANANSAARRILDAIDRVVCVYGPGWPHKWHKGMDREEFALHHCLSDR